MMVRATKMVGCLPMDDRADYEWAREQIETRGLAGRCPLLFSPVHGQLDPKSLAQWMLEDRVNARLARQLHKEIWGDEPGR